jgi:hypothetical protein
VSDVKETPAATPAMKFMAPVVQISVMVTVIVSVILTIFAWPVATASPKNIPVGVTAAQAGLVQGVKAQFEQQQPGVFNFIEYKDLEAAKTAIAKREVYGALVLTQTPQMLVASGASPAMTQILTSMSVQLGAQLTAANGIQVINFVPEQPTVQVSKVDNCEATTMTGKKCTFKALCGTKYCKRHQIIL